MKLIYGNGECSIEGNAIRLVSIEYIGAIQIDDKTPKGYHIRADKDKITIHSTHSVNSFLGDLFRYIGSFKVKSAYAFSETGRERCFIQPILDNAEKMNTKAEDITLNSEDLNAGDVKAYQIKKTSVKQSTINNLNTADLNDNKKLVYADGFRYNGLYHIHTDKKLKLMSGETHTEKSKELFIRLGNNKMLKFIGRKR